MIKGLVSAIEDVCDGTRIVTLRRKDGEVWRFEAGQYMMVAFGNNPPRPYSIASRPGQHTIDFHIKDHGGEGNAQHVFHKLGLYEEVMLRGAYGEATYEGVAAQKPIVCIAGGTGIGQMKSIIDEAISYDKHKSVRLFYGDQNDRLLYMLDWTIQMQDTYNFFKALPATIEWSKDDKIREGVITDVLYANFDDLHPEAVFFLSGSAEMIKACIKILESEGVASERIIFDQDILGPKEAE